MSLGSGEKTKHLKPGYKGMPVSRMNAKKYAVMLSMMVKEPQTVTNLAKHLELSRHVVMKYIKELHEIRPKLVHIAEWQPSRLVTAPIWVAAYSWGNALDARRPPKKSMLERCRAYRARRKMRALDAIIGGVGR